MSVIAQAACVGVGVGGVGGVGVGVRACARACVQACTPHICAVAAYSWLSSHVGLSRAAACWGRHLQKPSASKTK